MKYLIDTNIILEILLQQDNADKCKIFLQKYFQECALSDFSLHSIGVLLFKLKRWKVYNQFFSEFADKLIILSLDKFNLGLLSHWNDLWKLDFDDAYQAQVAKINNLILITLDNDFKKVVGQVPVNFLSELVE